MKLNIRATAFALAVLWGGAVLITGLANFMWSGYGSDFLRLLTSIYPGYKGSGSIGDLMIGILYAIVDGGLCGLVLAWLYNRFLMSKEAGARDVKREAGVHYPPVSPP